MNSPIIEVNFDGLPGPTHHYAGLALGNVASMKNAHTISNPRAAALEGLAKMRLALRLGAPQGIFLPHARPNVHALHQLGLNGTEQQQLETLYKQDLNLFCALFSSSFMWAANTATITTSIDAEDNIVHITPANLATHYHRSLEVADTQAQLKHIFNSPCFHIHEPLPALPHLADEGAANHMRIASAHDGKSVNVMIYGQSNASRLQPKHYPARQSLEASAMIAQTHHINTPVLFFQQHPDAIDAGVFHNDVAAINNESVLIYHEKAYLDQDFPNRLAEAADFSIDMIKITENELSLKKAVDTYFFNSQLVTISRDHRVLIMPMECKNDPDIDRIVSRLITPQGPIRAAHYVSCRQSMQNGGGPACLRLRVPMSREALASVNQAYILNHEKIDQLEAHVNRYYRDRLTIEDFLDPEFRESCRVACPTSIPPL